MLNTNEQEDNNVSAEHYGLLAQTDHCHSQEKKGSILPEICKCVTGWCWMHLLSTVYHVNPSLTQQVLYT